MKVNTLRVACTPWSALVHVDMRGVAASARGRAVREALQVREGSDYSVRLQDREMLYGFASWLPEIVKDLLMHLLPSPEDRVNVLAFDCERINPQGFIHSHLGATLRPNSSRFPFSAQHHVLEDGHILVLGLTFRDGRQMFYVCKRGAEGEELSARRIREILSRLADKGADGGQELPVGLV